MNNGQNECDDGNSNNDDGCDSSCKIEKNYFCEQNSNFKDICTEMSYQIDYIRFGIKEFYLKFNFPVKSVKKFAEQLSVSIDPKNNSAPYSVKIKSYKAINSTTIRINVTLVEKVQSGSILIVTPEKVATHEFSQNIFYKAPYIKDTIETEVCDQKCPPNSSKGLSASQAVLAAVSTGISSGSSIAMGMNFAAVWTLGSLMQFITLFSLINIPVLPRQLLDYYNGMGLANLNFIPNIIKVTKVYDKSYIDSVNNSLDDNARYHSNIF